MNKAYTVIRVDSNGSKIDLTEETAALKGIDAEIFGVDAVTEQEIIEAVKNADVVLTAAAKFTRRVMECLPKLKAIIRYGVGYDTIDVKAATELGILLVNNPADVWCDEEVSNQAIALMLACARKIVKLHNLIVGGEWKSAQSSVMPAVSIHGQVAGIIGCGAIGRKIASKLKAFNIEILGHDPYLDPKSAEHNGIRLVSMAQLLKNSDFVFVQTLLNDETYHMIGEEQFALMKKDAYIINCARGEVIDEKAMIKALEEKRIAGAGLDVFENEPPSADNPLFKMDNVTTTPHCASWSTEAFKTLRKSVGTETAQVLNNILPKSVVNKEVKPRFNVSSK